MPLGDYEDWAKKQGFLRTCEKHNCNYDPKIGCPKCMGEPLLNDSTPAQNEDNPQVRRRLELLMQSKQTRAQSSLIPSRQLSVNNSKNGNPRRRPMNKLSKSLLILFSLIAISLGGFSAFEVNNYNNANLQINILSSELQSSQSQLSALQDELTDVNDQLNGVTIHLSTSQDLASSLQSQLASSKSDLTTSQILATSLQSQLIGANADLTTSQSLASTLQAQMNNISKGYGYLLNDVTYQTVKNFIAADQTDRKTYNAANYVCWNYSADVSLNAMNQHIRCGMVYILFPDSSHGIVAFNTIDKGVIYIDPQTDDEVNLQVGRKYWTQCVIPTHGIKYASPTTYDDTVESFTIVW
jgi:hypothetical protein